MYLQWCTCDYHSFLIEIIITSLRCHMKPYRNRRLMLDTICKLDENWWRFQRIASKFFSMLKIQLHVIASILNVVSQADCKWTLHNICMGYKCSVGRDVVQTSPREMREVIYCDLSCPASTPTHRPIYNREKCPRGKKTSTFVTVLYHHGRQWRKMNPTGVAFFLASLT